MAKKQSQVKWWLVTTKPNFPAIGQRTFRVPAKTSMDAKSVVVMQEFNHCFTGLFSQMTAKLEK